MSIKGWLCHTGNDTTSFRFPTKNEQKQNPNKLLEIREMMYSDENFFTSHMRQFLICTRNQWKIFSLEIRREKEKQIFSGFPHKTFSGEDTSLGCKIIEERVVVFVKAK